MYRSVNLLRRSFQFACSVLFLEKKPVASFHRHGLLVKVIAPLSPEGPLRLSVRAELLQHCLYLLARHSGKRVELPPCRKGLPSIEGYDLSVHK